MEQSVRDIGKVDVVFNISIDGKKRGELHLSKGGVDWWPGRSKTIKHSCTWTALADFLETKRPRRTAI
jgi:hypothetical protein